MTPPATLIASTDQARDFAKRSAATRQRKAATKRRLKVGQLRLAEVLREVPADLERLTLYRLLVASRGIHYVKAQRIVRTATLAADRPLKDVRVQDLSVQERRFVIGAYVRHCPGVARS